MGITSYDVFCDQQYQRQFLSKKHQITTILTRCDFVNKSDDGLLSRVSLSQTKLRTIQNVITIHAVNNVFVYYCIYNGQIVETMFSDNF